MRGTELSARLQNGLIVAQTVALRSSPPSRWSAATAGTSPLGGLTPHWAGWTRSAPAGGADRRPAARRLRLLGLGVGGQPHRGDRRDPRRAPGRAGVWSTVALLVTYLGVATAVLAFAGPTGWPATPRRRRRSSRCSSTAALGGWDWWCCSPSPPPRSPPRRRRSSRRRGPACRWPAGTRCRSASRPSTLATVPPTSRPGGSPASRIAWYVAVGLISENALFDSITGAVPADRALLRADRSGLRGLLPRQLLAERPQTFLLHRRRPGGRRGPARSGCWCSRCATSPTRRTHTPAQAWLGVGPPLVIGVGVMAAGVRAHARGGGTRDAALLARAAGRLRGGRAERSGQREVPPADGVSTIAAIRLARVLGRGRGVHPGSTAYRSCPVQPLELRPGRGLGVQRGGEVVGHGDGCWLGVRPAPPPVGPAASTAASPAGRIRPSAITADRRDGVTSSTRRFSAAAA